MPYKVFISHNVAQGDYILVTNIANLLWQDGMEVYIPEWYPRYTEAVNKHTASQIQASDIVIAIVTSATSRSTAMSQEIGFALAQGKSVIALVEEGINTEGFLDQVPKVDLNRWDFEKSAESVLQYLKQYRKDTNAGKALGGLILLGLGLWVLSQLGRSED